MKILHLIPSYFPATKLGGPIVSVHMVNKLLIKEKISVDVLTLNAGLENSTININTWYEYDGVKVKYFKFKSLFRYAFSWDYLVEVFKNIKKYDIIHITAVWNFPVLAGLVVASIFKKPYIISPRGALYSETVKARKHFLKKLYFNYVLKRYFKKSAAIHFTSEMDKERFLDFTHLNINSIVIPNGLVISDFQNKMENSFSDNEFKYILFLGRLSPIKGIDLLLPAFKKILYEFPDIVLILAGPDEEGYLKIINEFAYKLNLINNIKITGLLEFNEKLNYLKRATILILPSYSENFGNVVIEALACKVPVVISNKVGIYREIERSHSGLICELNSESIYSCIKRLLLEKELRASVIENGYNLVKNDYTLEATTKEFIKTYKMIIENRKLQYAK